jgi:hypothetical protein
MVIVTSSSRIPRSGFLLTSFLNTMFWALLRPFVLWPPLSQASGQTLGGCAPSGSQLLSAPRFHRGFVFHIHYSPSRPAWYLRTRIGFLPPMTPEPITKCRISSSPVRATDGGAPLESSFSRLIRYTACLISPLREMPTVTLPLPVSAYLHAALPDFCSINLQALMLLLLGSGDTGRSNVNPLMFPLRTSGFQVRLPLVRRRTLRIRDWLSASPTKLYLSLPGPPFPDLIQYPLQR